ncbi:HNH endonuclease signature motif containing protein [Rhodococcus sp. IEGM 1370]|uniref:HNH endonuclease n=1 Tax=Rhodococcus sp. IEGM 1370 TaxID=3082222 RepID=UPI00295414EC|nr:HNH endonuclease signature motif containing protein [Rhodococcus sp. IEGM 1370]MDV8076287.1 HNH endonuclease signature motif containing protein [Rhodococcus sp. IEGM 1370]
MKGESCWYCGKLEPVMHVDHAIPLARGGTDDWTNLVNACPTCNLRKHAKTEQEFFALIESERDDFDPALTA